MTTPDTLGERLRARRTALDLTLAEVAERSGLSLPYVSNLERGHGNPTMDALRALAGALEASVGAFLDESSGETDLVEVLLASAPNTLRKFARSDRFRTTVDRLAREQGKDPEELRRQVMVSMASAPRRSSGEPTEDDWRRLLDVYSLILNEE